MGTVLVLPACRTGMAGMVIRVPTMATVDITPTVRIARITRIPQGRARRTPKTPTRPARVDAHRRGVTPMAARTRSASSRGQVIKAGPSQGQTGLSG